MRENIREYHQRTVLENTIRREYQRIPSENNVREYQQRTLLENAIREKYQRIPSEKCQRIRSENII